MVALVIDGETGVTVIRTLPGDVPAALDAVSAIVSGLFRTSVILGEPLMVSLNIGNERPLPVGNPAAEYEIPVDPFAVI